MRLVSLRLVTGRLVLKNHQSLISHLSAFGTDFRFVVSCRTREAVYILDGLMKYNPNLQPDTIHADTEGQSEPVFGLAHLLGIQLMPRMRNWNDVTFYRPSQDSVYQHIDTLFTKHINWQLIQKHWQDMKRSLRLSASLRDAGGLIDTSRACAACRVRSHWCDPHATMASALIAVCLHRELGRVIRTIFLLQYISEPTMRRHIRGETTKVESYHDFCDWVQFGGQVINSGDPVEQEKRVKYMNLVANIVILHNVFDLTKVLTEMNQDGYKVTPQLAKRLSPYMTEHIRRFGHYVIDMEDMPEPLQPQKLPFI